jgi:hypothetical protein
MRRTRSIAKTVLALSLLTAARAWAVDGAIEISHAKALAGAINGSTAQDPGGYPVVITAPGSYVLTGDLTPPPDTSAIAIDADDVSIDLHGFSIRGANSCSGGGAVPVVCTVADRGRGIDAGACPARARVRDGRVVGMGNDGVNLCGPQSRIERVDAAHNGGDGLKVGIVGSVSDSSARLNLQDGIDALGNAAIRDNTTANNGANGIRTDGHAVITGNTSRANRLTGIAVVPPAGDASSIVRGNTASENGNDGIALPTGLAEGNSVEHNRDCGIVASTFTGVGDNVVTHNPTDGCGAFESCCSFQGAPRYTGCNVLSTQGTTTRCCPSPTAGEELLCHPL